MFSLSLKDVVSDSLVAEQFLNGTIYTKRVNLNDTFETAPYTHPNCTLVGYDTYNDILENNERKFEKFYRYD